MISSVLLMAALVLGLTLVPVGLPGLWVMLGATLLHWLLVPGGAVGAVTFVVAALLVVAAEVLEFTIAGRYAQRYGGSRRASVGAIVGGLAGAFVGLPVPVLGSMLGAFVGAFAGALVGELTVARAQRGAPLQVARGALIGRVTAAAVKTGFAVAVLAWVGGALVMGGS